MYTKGGNCCDFIVSTDIMIKKLVIPFCPIVKAAFADKYSRLLDRVDLNDERSVEEFQESVRTQVFAGQILVGDVVREVEVLTERKGDLVGVKLVNGDNSIYFVSIDHLTTEQAWKATLAEYDQLEAQQQRVFTDPSDFLKSSAQGNENAFVPC
jgi:hypothetical protein